MAAAQDHVYTTVRRPPAEPPRPPPPSEARDSPGTFMPYFIRRNMQ